MHERASQFREEAAERYGLDVAVEEFPDHGTPTAEDAAAAIGCAVDQIVKSLVFWVDAREADDARLDGPVVCLTAGANRVSETKLAAECGVDPSAVSMASPDQVREATGWAIGGVPPICHATDVPALLDPRLTAFDEVWAAAGTPDSVWPIDPDRLLEVTGASVVDVTE
jgi:prolyl-tRNA editing enzyme YbaK/EbsC (Cys-tRNA(Pro) deacylase)